MFNRIWELDFLRGVALILMIIFHLVYDLNEFYNFKIVYSSGLFYYTGKIAVILFILVSAVSSAFSRSNFKRALKFLAIAMLITLITHLYNKDFGIKYGILHFLGTCILLYPFLKEVNRYILIFAGTTIIFLGRYLHNIHVNHNYLFLFNMTSDTWISSDYYPLFPWLGVFMYGITLGRWLYPTGKPIIINHPQRDFISFIGKHTLFVYLIHQPILLALISFYIKIN